MKKVLLGTLLAVLAGCTAPAQPWAPRHQPLRGQAGTLPGLAPAADPTGAQALAAGRTRSLIVMPEAGPAPILAAIRDAKTSIDIHMYLFMGTNVAGQVLAALVEKARAGVAVRVILDGSPFTAPKPPECQPPANPVSLNKPVYDQLQAAGVQVKWSDPRFRFTHQKSILIDRRTALIMTMNFTSSAFTANREYVVVDRERSDVAEVGRIFDADWTGGAYTPQDPDLVVSPQNSRARILSLIDSARRSLTVQVEFMNDKEVYAHLADRVKAGVDVSVMLAYAEKGPCSTWDTMAEETKQLQAAGVAKYAFLKKIKLHAKAIVADGARAFVGSENFTSNSLNNNRELGLLLADRALVGQLAGVMAQDWANKDAGGPGNATDLTEGFAAAFGR